jgi:hypothetical protein
MENETPVVLKNVVELPAKHVSVAIGRAAVTARVPTTLGTRQSSFSENLHILSEKPIRRPASRKLQ